MYRSILRIGKRGREKKWDPFFFFFLGLFSSVTWTSIWLSFIKSLLTTMGKNTDFIAMSLNSPRYFCQRKRVLCYKVPFFVLTKQRSDEDWEGTYSGGLLTELDELKSNRIYFRKSSERFQKKFREISEKVPRDFWKSSERISEKFRVFVTASVSSFSGKCSWNFHINGKDYYSRRISVPREKCLFTWESVIKPVLWKSVNR